MNKLNKKFSFINEKGEREELKITPEGSMWILAYGYDTIAEWKRVKRLAQLENKAKKESTETTEGNNEEKKD